MANWAARRLRSSAARPQKPGGRGVTAFDPSHTDQFLNGPLRVEQLKVMFVRSGLLNLHVAASWGRADQQCGHVRLSFTVCQGIFGPHHVKSGRECVGHRCTWGKHRGR